MKLGVIWVGKTRDTNMSALIADFSSRIRKFLPLDVSELKDSKSPNGAILASLGPHDRVVALDSVGRAFTSAEFAGFVGKHMRENPRPLVFVIGPRTGLTDEVRKRAELTWSLSSLTFTHDMARVMLLEQIYRALAAVHNHPYPR